MSRFYNVSPEMVENWDGERFNSFWQSMTRIEAQESLRQMKIMDYPFSKAQPRREFHRDMMRMAFPRMMNEQKAITIEELRKKHQPNFDRMLDGRRKSQDIDRT